MFQIVVESVKYIQGIPVELTEAAVSAGELRKGSVVGLVVHPVADSGNRMLLEARLSEDGQEKLLRPGSVVPLEGEGSPYRVSSDWVEYLSYPDYAVFAAQTGENGLDEVKVARPGRS